MKQSSVNETAELSLYTMRFRKMRIFICGWNLLRKEALNESVLGMVELALRSILVAPNP